MSMTFEEKIRYVRTIAGSRRYGLPIGSPIVPGPRQHVLDRFPKIREPNGVNREEARRQTEESRNARSYAQRGAQEFENEYDRFAGLYYSGEDDEGDLYEDMERFSQKTKIDVMDVSDAESYPEAVAMSNAWVEWDACRSIRKAARKILGIPEEGKSSAPDPHLARRHSFDPRYTIGNYAALAHAYTLLSELNTDAIRSDRRVYRGVKHPDPQAFAEGLRDDSTFELPLASFTDSRRVTERFGTDVLFVLEPGAPTIRGAVMGWADEDDYTEDFDDHYDLREYISGGRFKVRRTTFDGEQAVVYLKHVATYDPDTGLSREMKVDHMGTASFDWMFDFPLAPAKENPVLNGGDDVKARVRTMAGVERFNQPLGSIIFRKPRVATPRTRKRGDRQDQQAGKKRPIPKIERAKMYQGYGESRTEIDIVDSQEFRDKYLPAIFGVPSVSDHYPKRAIYNPVLHGGKKPKSSGFNEGPPVLAVMEPIPELVAAFGENARRQFNGKTEPIRKVYRAMTREEWDEAQERGYIQSDQRGNILQGWEGTNAGIDPGTAASYLPRDGEAIIVAIEVDEKDGWFTSDADSYLRSRERIPISRVKERTAILTMEDLRIVKIEGVSEPEDKRPRVQGLNEVKKAWEDFLGVLDTPHGQRPPGFYRETFDPAMRRLQDLVGEEGIDWDTDLDDLAGAVASGISWLNFAKSRKIRKGAHDILGKNRDMLFYDPHIDSEHNTRNLDPSDREPSETDRLLAGVLMDGIASASPDSPVLYRGVRTTIDQYEAIRDRTRIGDVIEVPLLSFTEDRDLAEGYGSSVVFELQAGSKSVKGGALAHDKSSPVTDVRNFHEFVSGGRFRVEGTRFESETLVVTIKQFQTFSVTGEEKTK